MNAAHWTKRWVASLAAKMRCEHWRLLSTLRQHSHAIVRSCLVQVECVAAQRVRRLHAATVLHWRLWGNSRPPLFLLGGAAIGLSNFGECDERDIFDWDTDHISDSELHSHLEDLEDMSVLREKTMTCSVCGRRLVVDQVWPGVAYCTCQGGPFRATKSAPEDGCDRHHSRLSSWTPFLERPGVLIWRQGHPKHRGLYAYKVHGVYGEVTASDFLRVQTDVEYRKRWDASAAELRVVETNPEENSDVIYWEMRWPRFLANRDYVFQRRFLVDHQQRVMVIYNRSTNHPGCPVVKGNHRVNEYWSVMVIKPVGNQDFHQPGIEFGLTYFDNPGLTLPSAVTTWVAFTALPDFLSRLRWAAGQLSQQRADARAKANEPKQQKHTAYA